MGLSSGQENRGSFSNSGSSGEGTVLDEGKRQKKPGLIGPGFFIIRETFGRIGYFWEEVETPHAKRPATRSIKTTHEANDGSVPTLCAMLTMCEPLLLGIPLTEPRAVFRNTIKE